MEIKIIKIGEDVSVDCFSGAPEQEQFGYSDVVGMLMAALDGTTRTILEKCNAKERDLLYDQLDTIFGNFLTRLFPEIDPEEFTLIDAAIVKAQDEIINDAYERGLSLEDALKEYHDKAVDYINQRRLQS